jgi:NAD(P)H-nitrite reductase large subunit
VEIVGMKNDIQEKGAIIQRDRQTYAIAPHIPAGLTDPATLRRIAGVAERHGAQLKITSAQRIAIIGLAEEELDAIWAELGEKPGAAIGLCVRSVKVCPGTDYCKRGLQDSVRVGLELDGRYHGVELPWKIKMGVSGCVNDCSEVCIKDFGLIGTPKGWRLMVGGNGGAKPRLSNLLAENLSDEQALQALDQLIDWYRVQNRKCRMGKLVEEVGLEVLQNEVLGLGVA